MEAWLGISNDTLVAAESDLVGRRYRHLFTAAAQSACIDVIT
jgi:hypothetical protein